MVDNTAGGQPKHETQRTIADVQDYPYDRIEDPCGDRAIPSVPRPPKRPMSVANLYVEKKGTFLRSRLLICFRQFKR